MTGEIKTSGTNPTPPKLRFAVTLLAAALALLAFETFHYFSAPPLDEEQKALLAWEGVRAPDFSVTNLDGQAVRLADLKGKRVLINFWATYCPPCLEETPNFVKLRDETPSADIAIIGLNPEDMAIQKVFAQRNGVNYPLAILQNVPSPYQNIVKIPVTLVIDRNGVIQHVLFYALDFKTLEKLAAEADFAGVVKAAPTAPK
jgi:peroxiredoxin